MKKILNIAALFLVSVTLVSFVHAEVKKQGGNDKIPAGIVYSEITDSGYAEDQPGEDKPIVWFIHGIKFFQQDFQSERQTLLKIYPDAKASDTDGVVMQCWDSPLMTSKRKWKEAVKIADDYSQYLAEEIKGMPPRDQSRLILAGYSLGARIVVRTAAKLLEFNRNQNDNEKILIRKIILAGAAIDNDDPDIAATYQVSMEPVDNIINTQDVALAFYTWIGEKHAALGTGYKSKDYPADKFHEFVIPKSFSHCKYLNVYKNLHNSFIYEIVAPQVQPNLNWKTMNKRIWWNVVDECHGWELQKNLATGHYRIVDTENRRRSWGHWADEEEMLEIFEIIKERLVQKFGESPLPEDWWKLINPIQDKFNINALKTPDSSAWTTLEEYKGWKLQITKKSEKEEAKPDAQQLAECLLKKMAYYEAKMEYEEMAYEYGLMKKEWNKEINNVKYTEEENVLKKEFKTEKAKLKKALYEKKKIYKQKAKEYKKVKKYDKTECRILAPDNRRRAQGTETNMRESFEDVKNQIDRLFENIPGMTVDPK